MKRLIDDLSKEEILQERARVRRDIKGLISAKNSPLGYLNFFSSVKTGKRYSHPRKIGSCDFKYNLN